MRVVKFDKEKHLNDASELVWASWYEVNEEDLDVIDEYDMQDGRPYTIHRAEAMVHGYLLTCNDIFLLYDRDRPCGILVCWNVFNPLMCIRMYFLDTPYRGQNWGFKFIEGTGLKPKRIMFQTRKAKEPEALLEVTEKYRTMIGEDEKHITWEMDWGS